MKPTLGVLITYFNEKELLTECLNSLLAQKEPPEEILVYDDASSFPAQDYLVKNLPVRVIRGSVNQGPAHGRNVLLQESKSDYIHYQDTDDLFHPDWAARARQVIQATRPEVVFTEITVLEDGRVTCEAVQGLKKLRQEPDLLKFCLEEGMLTISGVYQRSMVLALGGYDESIWNSEDFDFHLRLALRGVRYEIILQPLIFQRIRRKEGRSRNEDEIWGGGLDSLRKLSPEISVRYRRELSDRLAHIGSKFFEIGILPRAREAFALAQQYGPVPYSQRSLPYRLTARWFGPELAERIGVIYRRMLPEPIRRIFWKRRISP